jgi:hypothetical protein
MNTVDEVGAESRSLGQVGPEHMLRNEKTKTYLLSGRRPVAGHSGLTFEEASSPGWNHSK